MRIKGADIYSENVLTGTTCKYKSLKDACSKIAELSSSDKEITLLCFGNKNLDYIQKGESADNYYTRMKSMIQAF